MKKQSEKKAHAANVSFARATVAGPEMLAAILPLVDRILPHVSKEEADTLLAAIDKAKNGIKIVT